MNWGKITVRILFIGYVAFSILSLPGCKKETDENSTLDEIKIRQMDSVKLLMAEFDALPFDCNRPELCLDKTVIIDTTAVNIVRMGNRFLLRAEVKSSCKEKIIAELECNERITDEFNTTKTGSLTMAVNISSLTTEDYPLVADSQGGGRMNLGNLKVIMLRGECLAIIESSIN